MTCRAGDKDCAGCHGGSGRYVELEMSKDDVELMLRLCMVMFGIIDDAVDKTLIALSPKDGSKPTFISANMCFKCFVSPDLSDKRAFDIA